MADIAFLLLIFFLVSTTMDTDSGIVRKLPPMPTEETPPDETTVRERNIFVVLVNRNNQLLVEGEIMSIKDLKKSAKEFISNPYDDPALPAKEIVHTKFFGPIEVTTKHVISLQNDRGTSYEMYIAVQNELAAAYNDLRNEQSRRYFGVDFNDLDQERQDAIEEIYPMKISEAEPKNVGG